MDTYDKSVMNENLHQAVHDKSLSFIYLDVDLNADSKYGHIPPNLKKYFFPKMFFVQLLHINKNQNAAYFVSRQLKISTYHAKLQECSAR